MLPCVQRTQRVAARSRTQRDGVAALRSQTARSSGAVSHEPFDHAPRDHCPCVWPTVHADADRLAAAPAPSSACGSGARRIFVWRSDCALCRASPPAVRFGQAPFPFPLISTHPMATRRLAGKLLFGRTAPHARHKYSCSCRAVSSVILSPRGERREWETGSRPCGLADLSGATCTVTARASVSWWSASQSSGRTREEWSVAMSGKGDREASVVERRCVAGSCLGLRSRVTTAAADPTAWFTRSGLFVKDPETVEIEIGLRLALISIRVFDEMNNRADCEINVSSGRYRSPDKSASVDRSRMCGKRGLTHSNPLQGQQRVCVCRCRRR